MLDVITKEDLPCWMRMAWSSDPPAIDLFIHRDAAEPMYEVPIQIVRMFKFEEYGPFVQSAGADWGVGSALKLLPRRTDGFIGYRAAIPVNSRFDSNKCAHCKGSGEDAHFNSRCLYCHGAGNEIMHDYAAARNVSASLTLLTYAIEEMGWGKKRTSATTPQLISLRTTTQARGHDITGHLGIKLIDWLRTKADTKLNEPTVAMMTAWKHMDQAARGEPSLVAVNCMEGAKLQMLCGTGGCYIHTDCMANEVEHGHGCGFVTHNTDHVDQQLCFLAGLAALETQVRRELGL